jgi:hypothetical protein
MSDYPIPVRDSTGETAMTIICEKCRAEAVITADELLNEGLYECPADTERGRLASTEPRCCGMAVMKYEVADECPGCKRLGWWDHDVLGGCCSRRCQLQAEYAAALLTKAPE